jgi:hypothetical protein
MNTLKIPGPLQLAMIEDQQALFREGEQELDRKKRIAACLLVHELGERRGALG